LGEEFNHNPFVLFTLRGMNREELVRLLDGGTAKSQRDKKDSQTVGYDQQTEITIVLEPLVTDLAVFWNGGAIPDDLFGEVQIPATPAALVKRLGNFPFWRGEEKFLIAMESMYVNASPRGLEVFLGAREAKLNGKV
jgi:uncharacterized Zn finger protein